MDLGEVRLAMRGGNKRGDFSVSKDQGEVWGTETVGMRLTLRTEQLNFSRQKACCIHFPTAAAGWCWISGPENGPGLSLSKSLRDL